MGGLGPDAGARAPRRNLSKRGALVLLVVSLVGIEAASGGPVEDLIGPRISIEAPTDLAVTAKPTADVSVSWIAAPIPPLVDPSVPPAGPLAIRQIQLLADGDLIAVHVPTPGSHRGTHVFAGVDLEEWLGGIATFTARIVQGSPLSLVAESRPVRLVVDPQVEALRRLAEASQGGRPEVHFEDGHPRFVSVSVPHPDDVTDPLDAAFRFLNRFRSLYRLDEPGDQLFPVRVEGEGKEVALFFGQHEDGIPVEGATLSVQMNDLAITGTGGRLAADLPELREPIITASDAEGAALAATHAVEAERTGHPRLVYFVPELFEEPGPARVAWRIDLRGRREQDLAPGTWTAFVDAGTATVLAVYDGHEGHQRPGEDMDIETAHDSSSDTCWDLPWETENEEWFDESGTTGGTPDVEGFNAFANVHTTYAYFYDTFRRRSWDNDDEEIEMMLDVVFDGGPNASYVDGCDMMMFSDDWATLDVVAHEYTHGLDSETADLEYRNQSGAIDESFADVFASFIDGNWTLGEGLPRGTLRDLSDPTRFSDPDHFSNRCTRTTDYCSFSSDNGGVHTNSGIGNKAAFLMAAGGSHNGFTILPLGVSKTQDLLYRTLVRRLDSNDRYADLRDKAVAQARRFVADGRAGWATLDVCQVINAYASVGVGDGDRDCDGTTDGEDADDDGDWVPDARDNCPSLPNSWQVDTDGDGAGDTCDGDDDGDTVADTDDNCALVANTTQSDADGDGRGDVCDDDDGDRVLDGEDNCPADANPVQEDTDGDGRGDACDDDDDADGVLDANDNCRTTSNPLQEDSDGDGVGDVCDNCSSQDNPGQEDRDSDGLGDVCDSDGDGDGLLNEDDNCPDVHNPDQINIDGNLLGLACDENEAAMLSGDDAAELNGLLLFRDPKRSLVVPFDPCMAECPDWIQRSYRTQIDVSLPAGMRVRVLDERGAQVARASSTGAPMTLDLRPKSSFWFRSPTGATFSGGGYFMEISPLQGMKAGTSVPIAVGVFSRHVFKPIEM